MDSSRIPPDELVAHAGFVRSLAIHLLRNDADADDAAQETLARAIARPPNRAGPLRPWLSGILRNVVRRGARDSLRREQRETRVAHHERTASAEDFAAREQILRTVGAAVLALNEPLRAVVLLRHYEGLPPRDIAVRLGIPVETVKSRLKRAHERLREALDEGRMGNVEGWRSSLPLLIGLEPDHGAGPIRAIASTRAAAGGITMPGKSVLIVGLALVAVCGVVLLVWKGSTRPNAPMSDMGPANQSATGAASDDRPSGLAPSPRSRVHAAEGVTPEPESRPAEAATTGPAAGWKRWTIGAAIQLDIPETWEHSGPPADSPEQSGSWSTAERPWPNAMVTFGRDGGHGYEKLLAESSVSATEQIQCAGQTATLRIVDPKTGPPGIELKAMLVTSNSSLRDGRPLEFFAASPRAKFAELDPLYRAVFASVRLVASDATAGGELPSPDTLRAYEGESSADVFEGVVLLGDQTYPGGEVRIGSAAKPRTAPIGADGRFHFEGVEASELGHVTLAPTGTSPRELFLGAGAANARRRVILVVGRSSIEGRVFDRNGLRAPGVPVRIMPIGRRPSPAYADVVVLAQSDADGSYRADHLLPGRYQVHATLADHTQRDGIVEISGAKPAPCDLGAPVPESTLSGVVRRVGQAVPGPGYLLFSGTNGKTAESVPYDANGRYSVRLAAGNYLVRVQLPTRGGSVLLDAPIIVAAGVSTTDLTLPSGRLRGRMIDATTRLPRSPEKGPRNATQLCLQLQGNVAFQTDLCVQIADDGTFQLDYLAAGRYVIVTTMLLAPGPDGKPRVIEVLDGGAETVVELELLTK